MRAEMEPDSAASALHSVLCTVVHGPSRIQSGSSEICVGLVLFPKIRRCELADWTLLSKAQWALMSHGRSCVVSASDCQRKSRSEPQCTHKRGKASILAIVGD